MSVNRFFLRSFLFFPSADVSNPMARFPRTDVNRAVAWSSFSAFFSPAALTWAHLRKRWGRHYDNASSLLTCGELEAVEVEWQAHELSYPERSCSFQTFDKTISQVLNGLVSER